MAFNRLHNRLNAMFVCGVYKRANQTSTTWPAKCVTNLALCGKILPYSLQPGTYSALSAVPLPGSALGGSHL